MRKIYHFKKNYWRSVAFAQESINHQCIGKICKKRVRKFPFPFCQKCGLQADNQKLNDIFTKEKLI